jgi:hypothetical protein
VEWGARRPETVRVSHLVGVRQELTFAHFLPVQQQFACSWFYCATSRCALGSRGAVSANFEPESTLIDDLISAGLHVSAACNGARGVEQYAV